LFPGCDKLTSRPCCKIPAQASSTENRQFQLGSRVSADHHRILIQLLEQQIPPLEVLPVAFPTATKVPTWNPRTNAD
jgi:hypothetical protein